MYIYIYIYDTYNGPTSRPPIRGQQCSDTLVDNGNMFRYVS